jgi:uroporphyrinogen decarboxylase
MGGVDMLWQPAVYEHKASLIGKSPVEVANSSELLTQAVLKEHEIYGADYITVGLDVYNIEAEAMGMSLRVPHENACPDLEGRLFDLKALPEQLNPPSIPGDGRFGLFLEAGQRVQASIGTATSVRVAASGPITMASKLVGVEPMILSLCMEDGAADRLLAFTAEISQGWCRCLRQHDLKVALFESIVAPPMFSPAMFESVALPLLQQLMQGLKESGQTDCELVIGGDTTAIANLLPRTGANILLCDYATDASAFQAALGDDSQLRVRRNINPQELRDPTPQTVEAFCSDLSRLRHPIAGTGILPYDFPPKRLIAFKEQVNQAVDD